MNSDPAIAKAWSRHEVSSFVMLSFPILSNALASSCSAATSGTKDSHQRCCSGLETISEEATLCYSNF
jgi:hypothetical protein